MDYNKILADFYNTEINSHSRFIIGLAVILFALSDIALSQPLRPFSFTQYWIWISALVAASFAFWYSLMRQLVYGALINRVLHVGKFNSFEEAHQRVVRDSIKNHKKILAFLPIYWFISVGSELKKWYWRFAGFLFCLSLCLLTTFLLVLLLQPVELTILLF